MEAKRKKVPVETRSAKEGINVKWTNSQLFPPDNLEVHLQVGLSKMPRTVRGLTWKSLKSQKCRRGETRPSTIRPAPHLTQEEARKERLRIKYQDRRAKRQQAKMQEQQWP